MSSCRRHLRLLPQKRRAGPALKPCVCTAKSGLNQADGNGLLPDPPMQQDCYCPASVHELLEACCGYYPFFLLQHWGKAGVWQSRNRIIAGGWQALGLGLLKPRVRREQAVCSGGARRTSSVCSWTLQPRCAFPDFAAVLLGHQDALLANACRRFAYRSGVLSSLRGLLETCKDFRSIMQEVDKLAASRQILSSNWAKLQRQVWASLVVGLQ